jgi:hypothetical protein
MRYDISSINFDTEDRLPFSIELPGHKMRSANDYWVEDDGTHSSNSGKQVEVMQYTELKDKDGKEIYEGDIISFKDFNIVTGVVTWSNNGFWDVPKIGNWLGNLKECGVIEVIGNIYENPELLTA